MPDTTPRRSVSILLAEDDPGHARLIQRNLRRGGVGNDIEWVANGQAAIEYIDRHDVNESGPLVMVLDLDMPVMDGYDVLDAIKSSERHARTPIIVLTTSDVAEDVQRCYDLGCNVFVNKPVEFEAFGEAVRSLGLMISVMSVP